MSSIAVIIPCLNEAQTIGKVVTDFRRELPDADIYVYDNASTDATIHEGITHGAIIRKVKNRGKGHVLRSALRDITADRYVLVDGDDTYPADAIHDLLDELDDGYDLVVGDRLSSTYFTENKRPFHNVGNRVVRGAINWAFHAHVKDVMSGYRVFNRRFAKTYAVLSDGFEVETEMTIHALDKRLRVAEVPITYRDRPEGSHSKLKTFSDGFKVLNLILRLFYKHRPLPFFCGSGTIIMLVGTLLTFSVFMDYWKTGVVLRFPTLIGSVMLIVLGVICFFTGLILDVIARNDREKFSIEAEILCSNR
jgi:glycosyltransferase involved in cell wall biosynthesis